MCQGTSSVGAPMLHASVGDGGAVLQIVCAWCQQLLRRQWVQPPTRFPISYSICARCGVTRARRVRSHATQRAHEDKHSPTL